MLEETESDGRVTVLGRGRIETLSSYVPQAVLWDLASPDHAHDEPHAERFPAALLVIDITGFTALTAAAVRQGAAGTERLSRSVNAYLGQIIDLVVAHGGDISKIVGDALLPVWPARDEDLATATRRAAICGLAIATELGDLEVEGNIRLSVKVGLCAGEVAATHVGGLDGRWLFLLAGDAVGQLSDVEHEMQPGSLVASPQAWSQLSSRFVGQALRRGHTRITTTQQDTEPRPLEPVDIPAEHESMVRAYIPPVSLARLDAGQADWLAELRRTTAVFANVRGVANDTPDAVQLLHRVTLAAQRVFARYDGWLKELTMDDKGTTLVGAFGVPPFSHEDDPARAIKAALAIQSEIRDLGLSAGVGVATGPAFCGPFGNAKRRDFAILGQHMNLAARLMQAADDDGVLVDTDTHGGSTDRQAFERLAAFVLKGLTTPIDVYRVRGTPAPDRPMRLVDRTSEQAIASATLDEVKDGRGALVVLEGEPGIGKSKLVSEWIRRARGAGVDTITSAAAEIESGTPYHAWRSVFERIFRLDAVGDQGSRRAVVLAALGSANGTGGSGKARGSDKGAGGSDKGTAADKAALDLAPLLEPILSLDLADNEVTAQLSAEVRADNTRDLLIRVLREAASSGPLMVVLEDVHWLDSASWLLLLRARREIPSLLLVVTTRPIGDASDPLAPLREDARTLQLQPLSRDDAIALTCERTGASRIADAVAAVVQERAEGNPLFIEQLTYALRDGGRIVVENGLLRVTGTETLAGPMIPDTVERVITTRLDQLPPAEAMTLKVASVIGQKFAFRTLADIYPLEIDTAALVSHLDTLTRLDLVARTPLAPEPTYEFRHVITQEVSYNLMLSTQSRELHRGLAEWYERTYAADLSPFHAFLAHHWRKAGNPARAVDHLELAGAQALRTFANEEAIGFLEGALSLAAEEGISIDAARQGRWRLELGEAYVHMSRYREGRDHLEAGLRLLGRPAPGTNFQQGASLVGELLRQVAHRLRLQRGTRALGDQERADLIATFRAYERLAEASYYSRETLLPLYCVIRILNEAESSGIPAEIARGYAGTGALFGVVPLPRVAEWYLHRALERLNEVEDLTTHEIVNVVVGFYYIGAGMWEPAREQFRAVRRTARRMGDRRRLDDAVSNLMELEYLQGGFRAAADLADEVIASARARNDHRFEAEGLAGKAYSAWQLGDAAEAGSSLAALRKLLADEPDMIDELKIQAAGLQALIQLGRGEGGQALAGAEEGLRLTAGQRPTYFGTFLGYVGPAEAFLGLWETGREPRDGRGRAAEALKRMDAFAAVFPVGRPRAALLKGRHQWLLGKKADAFRSWRAGLAKAQELSMPYEEGLAHWELGRHLEPGDEARASHLGAAREIFGRLGASQASAALAAVAAAVVGLPTP
jgi:class 3 adenylate cyclase